MKPTTLQLSRNWQLKSQYHWDKDTIQSLFKERKHGSYEYLHWQFSQFLESWPLQLNHQWALACNRRSIPHYRILHMHVPTQRRPCICHPTFLTNLAWSHSSCSHLTHCNTLTLRAQTVWIVKEKVEKNQWQVVREVIRSFNEQVIAKNLCIKFVQMYGQGKSCCCPSTAPRQNIINFQIVHEVCCLPSLKIPWYPQAANNRLIIGFLHHYPAYRKRRLQR
jgi:hypothetical protein